MYSRNEKIFVVDRMGYAFISYSSKNRQIADSFQMLFKQNNIETWIAPEDIALGETYTSAINKAIKGASCFVLLFSEESQNSRWVYIETERAVSNKKPIFTIMIDDTPMNDDFEFMLSSSQSVAIRQIVQGDARIKRLIQNISAHTGNIKSSPLQADKPTTTHKTDKVKAAKKQNTKAEIGLGSTAGSSIVDDDDILDDFIIKNGTLIKYNGKSNNVVIPYGVISIGSHAFDCCQEMDSIEISAGVTNIDECAFYCCSNLISITIPDSVTSIGESAFALCSKLTSINISNNVTSIAKDTFGGCSKLTSIILPDGLTDIGESAFLGCSNLTTIRIPDSVISIGNCAFFDCISLESIEIPNSVKNIGDAAFEWCGKLVSVTLSNSLTIINNELFYGCSSLTSIKLPDGIKIIGSEAFRGCSSLESIDIPDSIISIEREAFHGCLSLSLVMIPRGIINIDANAFDKDKTVVLQKKDFTLSDIMKELHLL